MAINVDALFGELAMLVNAEESIVISLDRALNAYRGLLEFIRIIGTDALVNIVHATNILPETRLPFSFAS